MKSANIFCRLVLYWEAFNFGKSLHVVSMTSSTWAIFYAIFAKTTLLKVNFTPRKSFSENHPEIVPPFVLERAKREEVRNYFKGEN